MSDSENLFTTLAPLFLILVVGMLVYSALTGKNPISQALEGMVSGQFFGFQKIAQSVFDSKSCDTVDPKDRYACIQDKINYCTSTSLGNPLFVAQDNSCFTSRGVPMDGSKAICLMPPTANPYAATVGSLV